MDERLSRRLFEGVAEPEHHRQHADVPDLHHPGEGDGGERRGQQPHHRLQDDEQASAVDAIGDNARVRPDEQNR